MTSGVQTGRRGPVPESPPRGPGSSRGAESWGSETGPEWLRLGVEKRDRLHPLDLVDGGKERKRKR